MTKKLVLFDVDDTLIDHSATKSQIPQATVKAIKGLKKSGHFVGIATGRSLAHIKYIMKVLNIDMAVTYAGHLVVSEGEEIYRQTLHTEELNRFIKSEYLKVYPMIAFNEEHIYVKDFLGKVKKEFYKEENLMDGETPIESLTPMIKLDRKPREYLSFMSFNPRIRNKDSYLHLDFNPWGKIGFEIYSKGVNKYSGIKVLAKHLGVSMDDVYAFGDNYNDIHMLTHVKNSVAVGNGVQAVKNVASYVSPPIFEGGILTACIKLGLLEESYE